MVVSQRTGLLRIQEPPARWRGLLNGFCPAASGNSSGSSGTGVRRVTLAGQIFPREAFYFCRRMGPSGKFRPKTQWRHLLLVAFPGEKLPVAILVVADVQDGRAVPGNLAHRGRQMGRQMAVLVHPFSFTVLVRIFCRRRAASMVLTPVRFAQRDFLFLPLLQGHGLEGENIRPTASGLILATNIDGAVNLN
jgi:hypothetical protein